MHRALSYTDAMARGELRHKEFKLLAIGPRNLFRNYGITMVDKRIEFKRKFSNSPLRMLMFVAA